MELADAHPIPAVVVGVAVTALLATVAPPTVSIMAGSLAVVAAVRRVDGHRQYAWAGTIFVLVSAPVLLAVPTGTDAYEQTVFVSLVGFGLISLVILLLRIVVGFFASLVLSRVSIRDFSKTLSQLSSAIFGMISMAWSVLRAKERVARSTVIGILSPFTMVLDVAGISITVPGFWLLTEGIDMVLFVFVGTVLVGFHTLSSWHAFFQLRKSDTAKAVGERTGQAASAAKRGSGKLFGKSKRTLGNLGSESDEPTEVESE